MYIFFNMKNRAQRAQQSPSSQTQPNWEHLPNLEIVIRTNSTPSIHSRLLTIFWNSRLHVNTLCLPQYIFFSMKNRAQRAQEQNRAQSPTGTTCLIGNPDIWDAFPVALPPRPALPLPPKHPRWVYNVSFLPKYKFSNPKPAQQRAHHPITTSDIVYIYLLLSPTPPNSPALLYIPALLSGTLGKPTILPAYPKSLLLILTSPGTTAILGFFGWWGIPAVDL